MTIICACKRDDEVWIGADTRSADSGFVFPVHERKLIRAGRWSLGLSGLGAGQDYVAPRSAEIAEAKTPFAVGQVLRKIYGEAGFFDRSAETKNGPADHWQSAVLASAQGVWGISSDYCVIEPVNDFWATGSGQDFALAVGWTHQHWPARGVVELALQTACQFRGDCGLPLEIVRVD